MPPLRLVFYRQVPPASDEIRTFLDLKPGRYTYLVSTLALQELRRPLAPEHQVGAPHRSRSADLHLLFHRALRHFLAADLLSRAEERISLLRAIQQMAVDPVIARVLKHDVFTWRDALADLAEQGLVLAEDFPRDLQESLVNQTVGEVLQTLQSVYRSKQHAYCKQPFEEAAYAFLKTYQPSAQVVMEGFTFLTPLQRAFIETCRRKGSEVWLLFAENPDQAEGFAIMRRTYATLGADAQRAELQTRAFPSGSSLAPLQTGLFGTAGTATPGPLPAGVTLERHRHRHGEVAACIQLVARYLKEGFAPRDIAIVMRHAGEFQPLLQEEVALQGLSLSLGVPPRNLLLTPVGRFVLALYGLWQDGALQMAADTFEAILASGWMGADRQATTDQFLAVKAQFFGNCRSKADWEQALAAMEVLTSTLPPESRLPAAGVGHAVVQLWQQTLTQVEQICRQLFSGSDIPIGEHVDRLLDELNQLRPERMFEAERNIVLRIWTVLLDLANDTSLPISSAEFGDVLGSLVREYQSGLEHEQGQATLPADQIWVTTPEGIDGSTRRVVLYLGVDHMRVPRGYQDPWPFYRDAIGEHQERERYYFLTVVRAAAERLHLSYAERDEEGEYRPSLYLLEAARLLQRDIVTAAPPPRAAQPLAEPPIVAPVRMQRDEYELDEIAHFALCPFRYKLERLDPRARQYKSLFQLRFLAQAVWCDTLLTWLRQQQVTMRGRAGMEQQFRQAMEATAADMRMQFPAFSELDWLEVEERVEARLTRTVSLLAQKGSYPVQVVAAPRAAYVIPLERRAITVRADLRHAFKVGNYLYPFTDDRFYEEWLIPRHQDDSSGGERFITLGAVQLFASPYAAQQWWSHAMRTAFAAACGAPWAAEKFLQEVETLTGWITQLEAGHFPKNWGVHCTACSVRHECLGRLEREGEP